jgi:peptide/nickel transport system substrate-binding protein
MIEWKPTLLVLQRLSALAAALALVAAACAPPAPTAPSPTAQAGAPAATGATAVSGGAAATAANRPAGGTVTVRLVADWDSLDPHNAYNFNAGHVTPAMYDRLIWYDPAQDKVLPYIATSWTPAPGSITFTLRTDATCDDGTPVTAQVVADSYKRLFTFERNALAFQNWVGPGPYTVKADDPTHVTIGWSSQRVGEPQAFTYGIVCPAGLNKESTEFAKKSYGSGAYTLESAAAGVEATLKARKDWKWGPKGFSASDAGFPDTLVYKIVSNETTAANLVSTGGLDVADVSGPDINRMLQDKSLTKVTLDAVSAQTLSMNEEAGHPTSDITLRRALSYAIDPNAYNAADSNGNWKASPSIFARQAACYASELENKAPKPSMEEARSILQQGGYTYSNGKLSKDGAPIALTIIGSTNQNSGPEYLRSQAAALGIDAKLEVTDFTSMAQKLFQGKFDLVVVQYKFTGSPVPWITQYVGPVPTDGGNNWGRNDNKAAFDFARAAQNSSGAEQCDNWKKLQLSLAERYDVLPMAVPTVFWFSKTFEFELASLYGTSPWFHRKAQ